MQLNFLSGGRLQMTRDIYFPDGTADQSFELPVSCALLRHPQGNVLFDTGCHPGAAENGEERWGEFAHFAIPIFKPEEALIGQLATVGLTAADIDVVICSHLHFDHCGCNAYFDKATMICHADELRAARSADAESMGYFAHEWDVGLTIEEVSAQHDVFGDGLLTLVPLPGHTAGSMGALAVLPDSGAFLLASDAVPVSASLQARHAPSNTWDVELFLKSLDDVAYLQQQGAKVIFGHDDPQWQTLRQGQHGYR